MIHHGDTEMATKNSMRKRETGATTVAPDSMFLSPVSLRVLRASVVRLSVN